MSTPPRRRPRRSVTTCSDWCSSVAIPPWPQRPRWPWPCGRSAACPPPRSPSAVGARGHDLQAAHQGKEEDRPGPDPLPVPTAAELPSRLAAVAATIYLIFNEGYAPGTGSQLVRASMADEAIRLARLLVDLMPDEPTALGLLALLLLHDAQTAHPHRRRGPRRAPGRPGPDPLGRVADQRRGRTAGRGVPPDPDRPDRYAAEAAIAACHALAPSYDETDWGAIVSWYDVLVAVQDSPVVRLNRAVAVAERDGPRVGLALGGRDRRARRLSVVACHPGRAPIPVRGRERRPRRLRTRARPRDERAPGRPAPASAGRPGLIPRSGGTGTGAGTPIDDDQLRHARTCP